MSMPPSLRSDKKGKKIQMDENKSAEGWKLSRRRARFSSLWSSGLDRCRFLLTAVCKGTNTAHVTATSAEHEGASVELDKLGHAASLEVNLDSVVDLDVGVGVADGAAIVRDNVRDATGTKVLARNLAELVLWSRKNDVRDRERERER